MARRLTMDVLTFGWLAISVAAVGGCSTGTNNEPMGNGSNSGSSGSNGSDSGSGGGSGASTGSSSSGSSSGTPSSGSSTGSGSGTAMTGSSSGMSATGAATSGEAAEASPPEEASTPPEEAGPPPVSFATVYSMVIGSCFGDCHNAANKAGGLDMSSESAAYMNLTTLTSVETGCTEQLVVTNSATTSLLYQKVMGTEPMPSCGVKMPKGGTALSSAKIMMIENWINSGAGM
jgi:hypothetical protein